MRVAVTGSKGMVAHALLPRLEAAGVATLLLGRAEVSALVSRADLVRRLEGCDALVHLVGTIRGRTPRDYVEAHVQTTRRVTAAAEDAGAKRVVFLSVPGADPLSRNAYLSSKGRAEATLYQSRLVATVFRVGPVLGPGRPVTDLITMARSGRFVLPDGGRARAWPVAVDDVAALIAAALVEGRGAGDIFAVGGPAPATYAELAQAVAAALGVRARVVNAPAWLARLAARHEVWRHERPAYSPEIVDLLLRDLDVDTAALAREFRLPATTLDEAARAAVSALEARPVAT